MARLGPIRFIREQWSKPPPVTRKDLTGKTVIVVGANVGLGFEAAKHFASMTPGKLILACRNQAKGEEAVTRIQADTGCKTVELWIIDLADFASVKAFADKFNAQESRLDILVANSAVLNLEYETTKDGWETSIQVNHLATTLTALLLLPKMMETAQTHATTPRIVVVSSDLHYWTQLDDEALSSDNILEKISSKEYSTKSGKIMQRRYTDTKLFNIFTVHALVSRLPTPSPVTIDCLNPGYCYSSLDRNISGVAGCMDQIMRYFLALSTEVGSRQLVYAALAGREDDMQGGYISFSQVVEPSDFVVGDVGRQTQERLWSETVMILSKIEPKVQAIVSKYLQTPAA